MGDRYLNTTMNGLSLPSNDVNKKNIDLSLFSSQIIQNVLISKTFSSEFYGDFSAGNVNITSKEYRGKGFLEVKLAGGTNSRTFNKKDFKKTDGSGNFGFYKRYNKNPFAVVLSHKIIKINTNKPINGYFSLTAGKSFELNTKLKLSLFATSSFNNNYEFRDGPIVDYTNVFKKVFLNAKEYEYSTKTTAMSSALLSIGDQNKVKFTTLFLNNSSDQVGYYGYRGLGRNRDARIDTDKGFYQENIQFNQDLIFVNQLTGEHKFRNDKNDDEFILTWGLGYNNVFAHEPDRKIISIENFNLSLDNDPLTNPVFYTNNIFDNQRYFQKITDEELNSKINLSYRAFDNIAFNFGYNSRIKLRDFENQRYGYNFNNGSRFVAITNVNNIGNILNIDNVQFFKNQKNKLFTN